MPPALRAKARRDGVLWWPARRIPTDRRQQLVMRWPCRPVPSVSRLPVTAARRWPALSATRTPGQRRAFAPSRGGPLAQSVAQALRRTVRGVGRAHLSAWQLPKRRQGRFKRKARAAPGVALRGWPASRHSRLAYAARLANMKQAGKAWFELAIEAKEVIVGL